jgi:Ca2+-binding EF-hand superfamily protein
MKVTKKTAIALLAATFMGASVLPTLAMPDGPGGDWHGRRGAPFVPLFAKYDADGDGAITQEEVDAYAAKRFDELAGEGGTFTLDEFKASWYEQSRPRMVRAFQRLDRNGDGKVTRDEFDRASEAMFLMLDRDGSGELTRPVPGEGPMARGPGGPKGPMMRGGPEGRGGPRADRGPDCPRGPMAGGPGGRMMHGGPGGPGGPGRHWGPPEGRMGMHHGPGGHGGAMRGADRFVAFMEKYDLDGDGKVTKAEFDEVRGKIFESGLSGGGDAITLDSFATIWKDRHDEKIVRAFQRYDADGDLKVTFEEFTAPTKDFVTTHDSNGDGVLTKADRGGRKHHGPRWGGPKKAGMPREMPAAAPDGEDG